MYVRCGVGVGVGDVDKGGRGLGGGGATFNSIDLSDGPDRSEITLYIHDLPPSPSPSPSIHSSIYPPTHTPQSVTD
jgi:hypothetical protein